MQNLRKNKGFTLLELMLVIALVGVLALITAPKYGAIKEHYRLQSSADAVRVRLNHAKQLAMDRRENVYVKLSNNTVEVVDKEGDSLGSIAKFEQGVTFDLDQGLANGLHAGIPNSSSSVGLMYDNRGLAEAGGVVVEGKTYAAIIELRSISGASIKVYIKPGTAKVTIGNVN